MGKLSLELWERVAEEGKGTCYQRPVSARRPMHEAQDRAQKPEHTAATPSEPTVSRGRGVSVKRSIRGKSNHGSFFDNRDII